MADFSSQKSEFICIPDTVGETILYLFEISYDFGKMIKPDKTKAIYFG
ncbi:hypothetical protein SAMN05660895_1000 [Thermoflavifilum thermophilum]|uniref:Uncharacterized protein n=1 Tax=Thermoflavifilum thermophilum TaxID=1393122 RepID=A0A1I7N917_9BACT|nr:hypothetical protein SAMN05660895_1000 [Thermoflavifilum thermophilum]